jgi:hypothetical protein
VGQKLFVTISHKLQDTLGFIPTITMAILKDTFISAARYNDLPYIHEVSEVPKDQTGDLEALRTLLAKHNVPSGVSVRLIHKHYDAEEGEVMAFKKLSIPSYGPIQVMQPVDAPDSSKLKGFHYLVDDDGSLQAYEYTASDDVDDLSGHQAFVDEFCRLIVERGLQNKFGLKLKSGRDNAACTEFEFPAERSTIMIPEGMPIPDGEFEVNVITEWHAGDNKGAPGCTHTCSHVSTSCSHKRAGVDGCGGEMILGGQKVERGTPVWQLVHAVTEAW